MLFCLVFKENTYKKKTSVCDGTERAAGWHIWLLPCVRPFVCVKYTLT